jgi:hypothetical protein
MRALFGKIVRRIGDSHNNSITAKCVKIVRDEKYRLTMI